MVEWYLIEFGAILFALSIFMVTQLLSHGVTLVSRALIRRVKSLRR